MTTKGDKTCACGQPRQIQTKCKDCHNAYYRAYRARKRAEEGPEWAKGNQLRRQYNITLDQYKAMLSEQNGQCAICGTNDPGRDVWFVIDHDHACCDRAGSCGACVRGLVCSGCNVGLGHFKDNPDILDAAAAYVRARSIIRVT